jgi:transposase-like protein
MSSENEQQKIDVQPSVSNIGESRIAEVCPYCSSKHFVKRGLRENRYQKVQLYLCRNPECARTFTAQDVKGKHFPLNVVIEAMSYYNLGFSLEETCRIVAKKFGAAPEAATLSEWIKEYSELCRYERLRPYATKMCKPQDTIEVVSMAHRQLYRFRFHRPKTALMLTEFKNRNLRRLQEYLNAVSSETPHQYFSEGERMSDVRSKFSTADMIVKSKTNYANRLAKFVLQTVPENKARHEALQRFFIANDSCTVATEVPVYIRKEDIEHMQNILKFEVLGENGLEFKRPAAEVAKKKHSSLPKLLTGHIDLVQIRNGQVHIMDYKPNAAKERPIEQLTWYALALSRLTGLRLFEFTCAWFDEKDYFQFFPLHVVKKLQTKAKKPRRRVISFKDGTRVEVPRENQGKVVVV